MKPQKEQPATFDQYSKEYAALLRDPIRDKFAAGSGFFFERKIQVICAFLSSVGMNAAEMSWLDVGCGQGDLLRLGRSYFKSATGSDPSEGMLKFCEDLDVQVQPGLDVLPFETNRFDLVTAVCVYHHVPVDRRAVLTAEAFRVLRPGGIFCIIEHNPRNPITRLIVSRTPVDADAKLLTLTETRTLLRVPGSKTLGWRYFLLFPERLRFLIPVENGLSTLPLGGQYAVFAQQS
jgi:SAM-dependent methyltransferase